MNCAETAEVHASGLGDQIIEECARSTSMPARRELDKDEGTSVYGERRRDQPSKPAPALGEKRRSPF
jgi:hypothetical protein